VKRIDGHDDLQKLGGLYQRSGLVAVLFLIPAFSLAGFPPLSGFWAKFILIQASLEIGAYGAAAVALVVGLLTLYSMTKIWVAAFWRPLPAGTAATADQTDGALPLPMLAPVAVLAAVTLALGLGAQPLLDIALAAAEELLDPRHYVQAVLGGGP
jgi:multicomponent Na+:H+ antiporter subunit D